MKLVWPGMILAGLVLAVTVTAAWPESTARIVRLPDGESQPKTPAAAQAAAPTVRVATGSQAQPPARDATAKAATGPARVLAAVTPSPEPWAGPAPVRSPTELDEDYVQEPPEELGADPLPGADLTPPPPPVAG